MISLQECGLRTSAESLSHQKKKPSNLFYYLPRSNDDHREPDGTAFTIKTRNCVSFFGFALETLKRLMQDFLFWSIFPLSSTQVSLTCVPTTEAANKSTPTRTSTSHVDANQNGKRLEILETGNKDSLRPSQRSLEDQTRISSQSHCMLPLMFF